MLHLAIYSNVIAWKGLEISGSKQSGTEEEDFSWGLQPGSVTGVCLLTKNFNTIFIYQSSAPGSPSANPDLDKSTTENEEIPKEPESEFDPDAVVQEKCNEDLEDPFRHKPKLRGINLTEYPMLEKDSDFSSLCSIM